MSNQYIRIIPFRVNNLISFYIFLLVFHLIKRIFENLKFRTNAINESVNKLKFEQSK